MSTDPKSTKKTDGLTVLFALLGSAHIKAALKMLMKLTPIVNFTNILQAPFLNERVLRRFSLVHQMTHMTHGGKGCKIGQKSEVSHIVTMVPIIFRHVRVIDYFSSISVDDFKDVVWKRATELSEEPQLFVEGATRFDINQVSISSTFSEQLLFP